MEKNAQKKNQKNETKKKNNHPTEFSVSPSIIKTKIKQTKQDKKNKKTSNSFSGLSCIYLQTSEN